MLVMLPYKRFVSRTINGGLSGLFTEKLQKDIVLRLCVLFSLICVKLLLKLGF